jgi:hypothetical protein
VASRVGVAPRRGAGARLGARHRERVLRVCCRRGMVSALAARCAPHWCAVVAVRSLPALLAHGHARPRAHAPWTSLEPSAPRERPAPPWPCRRPDPRTYEEKQYRRAGICRVSTPKTHQPPKSSSHPPAPRVHFASAYFRDRVRQLFRIRSRVKSRVKRVHRVVGASPRRAGPPHSPP